ncbi:hypothetical protein K4L44_05405 [Halosquirtibacter laminarini]|uniref:Uncharacterized protein n=1 Tax=Halosquirtibacter laminarini TaxID=3374600 RepID=A0AC61NKM8_9BACT|nr:hypothetical protein K4L44_05405 [Prolixibacteraceae bacterium]
MKRKNTVRLLFSLLLFMMTQSAFSQIMGISREKDSYLIYKITDKEARKFFKSKSRSNKVNASFYHTLVDTVYKEEFLKRCKERSNEPQVFKNMVGHYIHAYFQDYAFQSEYFTIRDFIPYFFNDKELLLLKLVDMKGDNISDAKVTLGKKTFYYDENKRCYVGQNIKIKDEQKNVEVLYHGNTFFLTFDPDQYPSFRDYKYVTYVGYNTQFLGDRVWYDNKNFNNNIVYSKYYKSGYLIFSKPKYKPQDTLKMKAFILNSKGGLVNSKLKVVLKDTFSKVLGEVMPYRDGAYTFQFCLDDSLSLKLDRSYKITFEDSSKNELISRYFKFEEYDLKSTTLSIETDRNKQGQGKPILLKVEATDENGLNLLDGRVQITVTTEEVYDVYQNKDFIPDTLQYIERWLEPKGETIIEISDKNFPKMNFRYNIKVKMLNASNEMVVKNLKVDYHYKEKPLVTKKKRPGYFVYEVVGDSLYIDFLRDGLRQKHKAMISGVDSYEDTVFVVTQETPIHLKLNPSYQSYGATDSVVYNFYNIKENTKPIECLTSRTIDTVKIEVKNPNKIPFLYRIYEKDSVVTSGYDTQLEYRKRVHSKENYFVYLQYLWGGAIEDRKYTIALLENQLNVKVNQPSKIYPGETTPIEVKVTDFAGNPVENVDVSAYGFTSKFKSVPPNIPYLGPYRWIDSEPQYKKTLYDCNNQISTWNLEENEEWRLSENIGLNEIFKDSFYHPVSELFKIAYTPTDSITQFSPFVMHLGRMKKVHVVYVDQKPVYMSWVKEIPYSFRVDSGYHQIKLRTATHLITVDSLYFKPYQRLLFSLDDERSYDHVQIQKASARLTKDEQKFLDAYTFFCKPPQSDKCAYVANNGNLFVVNPFIDPDDYYLFHQYDSPNREICVGPLSGDFQYKQYNGFQKELHQSDLGTTLNRNLRRRKLEGSVYYDDVIRDEVKTEKQFIEAVSSKLNDYRESYLYRNPHFDRESSLEGNCRLKLTFLGGTPDFAIWTKYGDPGFKRVLSGKTHSMTKMKKGLYKVVFLYEDFCCQIVDSVSVNPNGENFLKVSDLKQDDNLLITKRRKEVIHKVYPNLQEDSVYLKRSVAEFRDSTTDKYFDGYIFSKRHSNPIEGAVISMPKLNYRGISNKDGYYKIPYTKDSMVYYVSKNRFHSYESDQYKKKIYLKESERTVFDKIVHNIIDFVPNLFRSRRRYGVSIDNCFSGEMPRQNTQGQFYHSNQPPADFDKKITAEERKKIVSTYISYLNQHKEHPPLVFINNRVFIGDITTLDPTMVTGVEILEREKSLKLLGEKGENGAIFIQTNETKFKDIRLDNDEEIDENTEDYIRRHFSDVAFWEPSLTTDKDGIARFHVTFPDDITKWQTYFVAMTDQRQSGQAEGDIRSFKPILSQLAYPKFLTEEDSTYVIGKVQNYGLDSLDVCATFEVNGVEKKRSEVSCKSLFLDTLVVSAPKDTLSVTYQIDTSRGYRDGERREIPVYPLGIEKVEGQFVALDNDTTMQLYSDPKKGDVFIEGQTNYLDLLENEISYLYEYPFLCNEQTASKLLALLDSKTIAQAKAQKFRDNRLIRKWIRRLKRHQNGHGLWGWWNKSEEKLWLSNHVIYALKEAKKMGFKVDIDRDKMVPYLKEQLHVTPDTCKRLEILCLLKQVDADLDYRQSIASLEGYKRWTLGQKLEIIALKQQCGIPVDLEVLKRYRHTTIRNNVFYGDNRYYSISYNNILNTLRVYEIFKRASVHPEELERLRYYFLEKRGGVCWYNTYVSSRLVHTLVNDMLKEVTNQDSLKLLIQQGDEQVVVDQFPFKMKRHSNDPIQIKKEGEGCVYLTSYQKYWKKSPTKQNGAYNITTEFVSTPASKLEIGKEVTLRAHVSIDKESSYMMVRIPIPAGCSYVNKNKGSYRESHREYRKNEVIIYYDDMHIGSYALDIKLLPRYKGVYHLNPASVENMYLPTKRANNTIKKVTIQ